MKTIFKIPVSSEKYIQAFSLEELVDQFTNHGTGTWSMELGVFTINIEILPDEANYCVETRTEFPEWARFRDFDDIKDSILSLWSKEEREEFYKECNNTFRNWFFKSTS